MAKTDIGKLMSDLSALVEERQDRMSNYQILRALITVAGQDDEKPFTRTQRCLEEARDALEREEGERG